MAKCMVEQEGGEVCGVTPEPGTSYEQGHQQLMRHLLTHIVVELQRLSKSSPTTVYKSEAPIRIEQVSSQDDQGIRIKPLSGTVAQVAARDPARTNTEGIIPGSREVSVDLAGG